MFSKISNYITDQIYLTIPDVKPEKREIIEYGAYMALSEISKITLLLIVSAIFHVFLYVLGIISIFGFLRMNLGGIHAKTHLGCLISYFLFTFGILAGALYLTNYRLIIDLIVIPFSFAVAYLYAPADMPVKPVASKKQRKRLRISGFILMVVLYISAQFAGQIWFNVIMLTNFLVSVLMTPVIYKITNNKYAWEEEAV
jgi:accessory gene regulator B